MIEFKMCPRCWGDMYLSDDIFGKYFSCFQCGYLRDLEVQRQEAPQEPDAMGQRKPKAA